MVASVPALGEKFNFTCGLPNLEEVVASLRWGQHVNEQLGITYILISIVISSKLMQLFLFELKQLCLILFLIYEFI